MLRGRGNRGGRQNLGVMLLAFQIFQFGIDRIPIITLVTLITNIGKGRTLLSFLSFFEMAR